MINNNNYLQKGKRNIKEQKFQLNIGNNMKNFDDIYERENKRFIKKTLYKKHELYRPDQIENIKRKSHINKLDLNYDSAKIIISCQNKISNLLSSIIKEDYIKKDNNYKHKYNDDNTLIDLQGINRNKKYNKINDYCFLQNKINLDFDNNDFERFNCLKKYIR